LLHIDLVREVPEAQKPRVIAINGGNTVEATMVPSVRIMTRWRWCASLQALEPGGGLSLGVGLRPSR